MGGALRTRRHVIFSVFLQLYKSCPSESSSSITLIVINLHVFARIANYYTALYKLMRETESQQRTPNYGRCNGTTYSTYISTSNLLVNKWPRLRHHPHAPLPFVALLAFSLCLLRCRRLPAIAEARLRFISDSSTAASVSYGTCRLAAQCLILRSE